MAQLFGTAPNQVPTNSDLGNLAFQNSEGVEVENINISTSINNQLLSFPKAKPSVVFDFTTDKFDSKLKFTRASTATYYDSTGKLQTATVDSPRIDYDPFTYECKGLLVEDQRTNLISSEFLDNAAVQGSGYRSVIDAAAIAPDGTMSAQKHIPWTDRTSSWGAQTVTGQTSGTYVYSTFIKDAGAGYANLYFFTTVHGDNWATFDLSNGSVVYLSSTYIPDAGSIPIGNGWYRCWVKMTPTGMTNFQVGVRHGSHPAWSVGNWTGDGAKGYYVWGQQLEKAETMSSFIPSPITFSSRTSIGSYFDENGLFKIAPAGVLRYGYGYDSTSGKWVYQGKIAERGVTNLLKNSSVFTGSNWQLSPSINDITAVATADTLSPDGTYSAYKLTQVTTNADAHVNQQSTITASTTTVYSVSWYLKPGTAAKTDLMAFFMGSPNRGSAVSITWATKTITAAAAEGPGVVPYAYGLIPVGNGWYRCWFVVQDAVGGTSTTLSTRIYPAGRDANTGYVYAWGAQTEVNLNPTTYIPTDTAIVSRNLDTMVASSTTRSADNGKVTGTDFTWFNNTEGTIVAEFLAAPYISGNYPRVWAISSGAYANSMLSYQTPSATAPLAGVDIMGPSSVYLFIQTSLPVVPGKKVVSVLAYKTNNSAASINGSTPITDTSCTLSTYDRLTLDSNDSNTGHLNSCIKRITYYPVRLSNSEIQALSAN